MQRHNESSSHDRVQRGSAASVRVQRNQPRARIDQRPRSDGNFRARRRNISQDMARDSSSRIRRIRPEITILSVAPMSEHPAFSDGHKGSYIPPEAPPSYEQAMRTSDPPIRTFNGSSANHNSQIHLIFPERHIVNSNAVTIPSYSESIAQQLNPTVTSSIASTTTESNSTRLVFTPKRTSVTPPSDIAARRDIQPTEYQQSPPPAARVSLTNIVKPPRPSRPPNRPTLTPKPKLRSSTNRNSNNNSDIEDGQNSTTGDSGSSIVTQSMASTNQDILSLFDSQSSEALHAPVLPSLPTPSNGHETANFGLTTSYSNLDGLFSTHTNTSTATPVSSSTVKLGAPTDLDGIFPSVPPGGASKPTKAPHKLIENGVFNSQLSGISDTRTPALDTPSLRLLAPTSDCATLQGQFANPPMQSNLIAGNASVSSGLGNQWTPTLQCGVRSQKNISHPLGGSSNEMPLDFSSPGLQASHPAQPRFEARKNVSPRASDASSISFPLLSSSVSPTNRGATALEPDLLLNPEPALGNPAPTKPNSFQLSQQTSVIQPQFNLCGKSVSAQSSVLLNNIQPSMAAVHQPPSQHGLNSQTVIHTPTPNFRPPKPDLPSKRPLENGSQTTQPYQRHLPDSEAQNSLMTNMQINSKLSRDSPVGGGLPPPLKPETPPSCFSQMNGGSPTGMASLSTIPVMPSKNQEQFSPTQQSLQGPDYLFDPPLQTTLLPPLNITPASTPQPASSQSKQQSRKLPPPPRPSTGPKRAPTVRPISAPPPRPTTKPKGRITVEAPLIDVFTTKPTPPAKPELSNTSSPSTLIENSPITDDLLGLSLFNDPPTSTTSIPIHSDAGIPSSLQDAPPSDNNAEPLYASVRKKDKVPVVPQPPDAASLSVSHGNTSLMEPTGSNLITADHPPPPLPTTRPPLEDFEGLLSPAEMNVALAQRDKNTNSVQNDDVFGSFSPGTAEEDPYEFVVEGLPHVKQTTAPPLLPAGRKKKRSFASEAPLAPSSGRKQNNSDASTTSDASPVERRKSEKSESKFAQQMRRKSMRWKQATMNIFKSSKNDEMEQHPTIDDSRSGSAVKAKSPPAHSQPPPRPASVPKRAPPARPMNSPTLIFNNNNVIPPAPTHAPPKTKPSKPPPPKITPIRAAPTRPTPNTNQNNCVEPAPAVPTPTPIPKPRSNSKPDPPLQQSPVPKVRSIPIMRPAPSKPSRAAPANPPTKKYRNLRPPPMPVVEKPKSLQEDERRRQGSKLAVVAIFDFTGAAEDELVFKAGDAICDVTEINSDWYRGLHGDKYGIFPKGFVTVQDIVSSEVQPVSWDDEPSASLEFAENVPAAGEAAVKDIGSTSYATNDVQPVSQNSITQFTEPLEIENVRTASPPSDNSTNETTYDAVALFLFEGQDESELSFAEGDVIEITGRVNEEWLSGRLGSKEGMFPAAFVQRNENLGSVEATNIAPSEPSSSSVSEFVEPMATATRDYAATSSEEISFKVGDVLYLLERINETWLTVQHDETSAVGNVPLSHINVVHPLP